MVAPAGNTAGASFKKKGCTMQVGTLVLENGKAVLKDAKIIDQKSLTSDCG